MNYAELIGRSDALRDEETVTVIVKQQTDRDRDRDRDREEKIGSRVVW